MGNDFNGLSDPTEKYDDDDLELLKIISLLY